jgi:hypothetical protein
MEQSDGRANNSDQPREATPGDARKRWQTPRLRILPVVSNTAKPGDPYPGEGIPKLYKLS